jgi:Domain of unknown function (DUF4476)
MRLVVGLFVILGAGGALAGPAAVDRELTRQELQTLAQQLAIAQQQLEQAPGARVQFAAALQQLQAAQSQVGELLRQVASAPPAQSVAQPYPPPAPPPTYLSPMGDATLRALVQQITAASFNSDKMNVLRQAASGNFFLVEQAARILPLYAYASERLAALQLLAPQLLDRANSFKLIPLFQYSGDRDNAQKILDAAPPLRAR